MRTEQELVDAIADARVAYHDAALIENATQLAARSSAIKALLDEQDVLLCSDAKNCPHCGGEPTGWLKTPAHTHRGDSVAAVYAIACHSATCQAAGRIAVGQTPKVAAFAWNEGVYRGDK